MSLFKRIRILQVNPKDPEKEAIDIAAEIIRNGGLVAFPTETVYGLGGNLLNKNVIDRLYKIKRRPADKPLTIHISNIDAVKEMVAHIPPFAQRLIDRFWPGPLTIILNSKDGKSVGFRMPSNKVALCLIEASGVPVVAPSANISGNRPPRKIEEVLEDLDEGIDMVLDGGPTEVGIESTVVDATSFPCKVLREGAIAEAELKEVWRNEEKED
ncbi:L-threonylcarbamoyladenylate synthase [Omnitrophica bacterium]|nr:L-threonylcarbamoyladenylate synthase [Candidatus Omnitrophota bacterium]